MAKGSATQQFVPIDRIRDGIITLKNGELRAILITSSLNLALKSEDEQQAILLQFQNLLNSLEFPVQFFAQSRRLNIKPYLDLLEERSGEVKEDLLKIQIHEYIGFIRKFAEETNIMTKHFFIVIPYLPISASSSVSGVSSLLGFGGSSSTVSKAEEKDFESARIQLEQRVATVMQGLVRFGVRAQKLGTEEAVELFYKLFNPGEQDRSAPKIAQA
jgi:type IV secretory pathway VirB4 component